MMVGEPSRSSPNVSFQLLAQQKVALPSLYSKHKKLETDLVEGLCKEGQYASNIISRIIRLQFSLILFG